MNTKRFESNFYTQDVLEIAPQLIGKWLVLKKDNGEIIKKQITEIEIYRGEEDTACHARAGRTNRTKPLYEDGGILYVYLCYGVHYLLNIVTSLKDTPQAILIRGIEGYDGPGKLTKFLNIDKSYNEVSLTLSDKIWIEDDFKIYKYETTPRIGIDYASEPYKSIEWRYVLKK